MKLFQIIATIAVIICIWVATHINNQELYHYAQWTEWLLDDSNLEEYPPAPLRVMSNFDTTLIDADIKNQFNSNITNQDDLTDNEVQERIDSICIFYDDICEKIIYDAHYTVHDKYTFLLYTTFLITQIDSNNLKKDSWLLRTTLSSIKFFMSPDGVRWQAWRSNVLINTQLISSKQELFEILTHEIAGHIFDLWVLDDPSWDKSKSFKEFWKERFGNRDWSLSFYELSRATDQYAHNKDFVSWYWSTNPFEGYAEFTNAWINHHAPLIKLATQNETIKKKYMKMREIYWSRFINLDIDTYWKMPLQTIPYDTTLWNKKTLHFNNLEKF